ncbi:alpha/beta fold hydrolase [Mycoplasmopsis phocirhinis]|uniref:Alpha/beta fold hydrolase n=1 Tax=Mycoplasmopsis phocirhinis TaxID=142650 RepID=A0A4P6MNA3_9BACT|nr:alpha/beta fold hydrolase [Mycoplasmopsis phocirhinis]QBF34360.1 alpha/beta fold hydrolase [Mycoplasmopsis phocirhinis]
MKFNYIDFDNEHIPIYTDDRKSDTTLFFLHGINSSSDFCTKLIDLPHKYNTVAINFPGSKYIQSENIENKIKLNKWYEYANEVIQQIKTKHIYILAHSMSGFIGAKLANHPRVKKVILLSAINPLMIKSQSYSMLKNLLNNNVKSGDLWTKILSMGLKFSSFGRNILNINEKWVPIIKENLLDTSFLEKLHNLYSSAKDKLIFIIGENDTIVDSKWFIEYAKSIDAPHFIIGLNHSPLYTDPQGINHFLNILFKPKKRMPYTKFIDFSKNVMDVLIEYEEHSFEDIFKAE